MSDNKLDIFDIEQQIHSDLQSIYDNVDSDPNAKLALCGKCKFNDSLIKYCKDNYYPFCRCVIGEKIFLRKCNEGQADNEGEELPQKYYYFGDIQDNLEICPKGYYIKRKNIYDFMFYESTESNSLSNFLGIFCTTNNYNNIITNEDKIIEIKLTKILSTVEQYRKKFHDVCSIRGALLSLLLNKEYDKRRYYRAKLLEFYKIQLEDLYLESLNKIGDSHLRMRFSSCLHKFHWDYSDS